MRANWSQQQSECRLLDVRSVGGIRSGALPQLRCLPLLGTSAYGPRIAPFFRCRCTSAPKDGMESQFSLVGDPGKRCASSWSIRFVESLRWASGREVVILVTRVLLDITREQCLLSQSVSYLIMRATHGEALP